MKIVKTKVFNSSKRTIFFKIQGLICLNCLQEEHNGHRTIIFKQFLENHKNFLQTLNEFETENIDEIISSKIEKIHSFQKIFEKKYKEYFHEADDGLINLMSLMSEKINNFHKQKKERSKEFLKEKLKKIMNVKSLAEFNQLFKFMLNHVNIHINTFYLKINGSILEEQMDEYSKKLSEYTKIVLAEMPLLSKKLEHLSNFTSFCENKAEYIKKLSFLNSLGNAEPANESKNIDKPNKNSNNNKKKEKTLIKASELINRKILIRDKFFKYSGISNDPKYLNTKEEVFCCFCNESSLNPDFIRRLGFFFGPYTYKESRDPEEKTFYCHELCAIWTSGITLDKKNSISNCLLSEVKRAKKLSCVICHEKGAGVGCQVKSCKFNAHFKCILVEEEILLDYDNFRIFCQVHKDKFIKENSEESEEEKHDYFEDSSLSKSEENSGSKDRENSSIQLNFKEKPDEKIKKQSLDLEESDKIVKKLKISDKFYKKLDFSHSIFTEPDHSDISTGNCNKGVELKRLRKNSNSNFVIATDEDDI